MDNLITVIQGNVIAQIAVLAVLAAVTQAFCKEIARLKRQGFVNSAGWAVVMLGAIAGGHQVGGSETALSAAVTTFAALYASAVIRRTIRVVVAKNAFRREQFAANTKKYFDNQKINEKSDSDSDS